MTAEVLMWVMRSFLICLLASVLFMSMVFLAARNIKRYDLVDAAWGWAFIVIAIASFVLGPGDIGFNGPTLVTALVVVWGIRLSWHIVKRIASTSEEDPRYTALRRKWRGHQARTAFVRIYMLQAGLATLISLPVIFVNVVGAAMSFWSLVLVGGVTWLLGFACEALADRQLRDFVSQPHNQGKLMQYGLWRYSRHPNYFGELVQWWGIFIIALSVPYGWVSVIGPVLLTFLIVFVSGIPLSEKRLETKPGWEEYKRRTSRLIPLPPRQ